MAFIDALTIWASEQMISFNKENHFRCFAHVINLSVQEFLKCLDQQLELNKVRIYLIKFL